MPSPLRILVTGASGFIGLHLVKRLLQDGHCVTTLCRAQSVPLDKLAAFAVDRSALRNRQGDLLALSPEELDILLADVDVVYHLAGLVSYRRRDTARQHVVNVEGTRKLALACLRQKRPIRFIHTSSIAGMGVPPVDGSEADESLVYNLKGKGLGYCDSKQDSENVILHLAKDEGLQALILSPGIIFGEGDTHSHHFRIFQSLSRGKSLFVPAGGIPFSYINDVVEAHANALEQGRIGERYCLVSSNKSFKEAALAFAKLQSGATSQEQGPFKSSPLLTIPAWLVLIAGLVCENVLYYFGLRDSLTWQQAWLANKKIFFASDKAVSELGFKQTSFEEMLRETTPYYLGKTLSSLSP